MLPKPRIVALPDGLRIYVNDEATIHINVADHFTRREYMRHKDYIPRRGWIVIDAGAYVGIYSLWASKHVGEEGLVIAFEPNPLAYQWLIRNITLSKSKNIIALPYALGDKKTWAILNIAKENIGASSLIPSHLANNPLARYTIINQVKVPVLTLDFIFDKSKSLLNKDLDKVDLVKIDVEGYEMNVLRGLEKSLRKGLVERLIIEVHKDQIKTSDLVSYLQNHGYRLDEVAKFGDVKDIVYLRRPF
jgi:FkbM family methyltransferase